MYFSRACCLLIVLPIFLFSCKHKKKVSLSGEEKVEFSDFQDFFKPAALPFVYSDASLQQKESDSLLISSTNLSLFVPDSVITSLYGKTKPKIYGLGKSGTTTGESYYFVKTMAPNKNALFILAFDKSNKYQASIKALQQDNNPNTVQSVNMDRRYSITQTTQLKNKDGSVSEGKDVYVLNAAGGAFTLIMTDPLVDHTEMINPIDTLPRKSKWAADYMNGKTNLVSIRDGRRLNEISFFIHFEKNNGSCNGEIKGEAVMKTANTAEYHEKGDPCILKFIFNASSVTLQEVEGCGSKRPIDCSLNGSFAKKKAGAVKKIK
jgi:hypothetical protein